MPNQQPSPKPAILLVDNGSLEPAATLGLRALAQQLSQAADCPVRPVSLLHSSAIDPALLHSQRAEILEPTLRELAENGVFDLIVVPLFFGPSGALTNYLPERVRHLQKEWPDLRVRLAPCLVDANKSEDSGIAALLADRVRDCAKKNNFSGPAIAVVDHGTPLRSVNAVRELVTKQTRVLLGDSVRVVAACSMERRPEAEYDFNEPLLEKLLDAPEFSSGEVIVAKMFLLPGRHAGPGGDIEQITSAAQLRHPNLKIAHTETLGSHPGLVAILKERLEMGLNVVPIK
jgi:sirohydrochlorin ferrochelatase